jgi:dipeptidyl aminopeptidase/acylaminoacyl peptidase
MKAELERIAIPDEAGAESRAWGVVARAYAERQPSPAASAGPRRRPRRAALVVACGAAALIAVAVSPAGSQLVTSVRHAVGLTNATPALTRLPADGRLLVTSSEGPWVVAADGSKRLLGSYATASWSPHGLFVAVTRPHELLAVDPKGSVRWSLARTGSVSLPRWAPDGYRIAYLENADLRIVAGDGTGDRLLSSPVAYVAPAWRPSDDHRHVLAFVAAHTVLEIVDVDSGKVLARHRLARPPAQLQWSSDGQRLAATGARELWIFGGDGGRRGRIDLPRPAGAAAFVPGSHELTVSLEGRRSDAVTYDLDRPGRRPIELFSGTGRFSGLAWAPDGRWLLIAWPTADQWLFVPSGEGRVVAVAEVVRQFTPGRSGGRAPVVDGWCCAP